MERQMVLLFIIYVQSSGFIRKKCDSFVYFRKLPIGIRTAIQLWKPAIQQISTEVKL